MSKGYSGYFDGTLGTTYGDSDSREESYSDRGIEITPEIKKALTQLKKKGDSITVKGDAFSMKDVSVMSKETGVEFAKVTINGKSIIIRGDNQGVDIPKSVLRSIVKNKGKFDFHSHPHNGDLVPSESDIKWLKKLRKLTGQSSSVIVTPDGKTSTFTVHGVVSTGTVSNSIDAELRKTYISLFGGK